MKSHPGLDLWVFRGKRGNWRDWEGIRSRRQDGGYDKRCVALFRLVGRKFQERRRGVDWADVM